MPPSPSPTRFCFTERSRMRRRSVVSARTSSSESIFNRSSIKVVGRRRGGGTCSCELVDAPAIGTLPVEWRDMLMFGRVLPPSLPCGDWRASKDGRYSGEDVVGPSSGRSSSRVTICLMLGRASGSSCTHVSPTATSISPADEMMYGRTRRGARPGADVGDDERFPVDMRRLSSSFAKRLLFRTPPAWDGDAGRISSTVGNKCPELFWRAP